MRHITVFHSLIYILIAAIPVVSEGKTPIEQLNELYAAYQFYNDVDSDHYNIDKAIGALEKANQIDSNNPSAQLALGELYFIKGSIGIDTTPENMRHHQKLAEKTLLRVIELDQKNRYAYSLLGQLYGMWGQHNSAVVQFQKAVSIDPKDYSTWLYLGMDYSRLHLHDQAIHAFKQAQQSTDVGIQQRASKLLQRASELASK